MPYVSAEVDFEQAQEAKRKDARIAELTAALDGIVHFADGFVFYWNDGAAGKALREWIEEARTLLAAVGDKHD